MSTRAHDWIIRDDNHVGYSAAESTWAGIDTYYGGFGRWSVEAEEEVPKGMKKYDNGIHPIIKEE